MEHSIFLHNMQPEQFQAHLADAVEKVVRTILAESSQTTKEQKEDKLLSRKEVCKLLKISFTSLNDKMKKGVLPYKRLGRRVLFQESEVMKAIETTKRRRG